MSTSLAVRRMTDRAKQSVSLEPHAGEVEDGNFAEGTGRKIVFRKHLTPNLYKAVAVADSDDEYRHGHHVIEAPASALQRPVDRSKGRAHLRVKITGKRFSGSILEPGVACKPTCFAAFGNHCRRKRALLLPRRKFKILHGVRGRREQHAESKNCRYQT